MLKKVGTKRLETDRLILRKFTLDDVDAVYNNWASDHETCKTLSWDIHESRAVTLMFITYWIEKYENPFNFNWVVELKDIGEVIGNICVVNIKPRDKVCELGFCYGSKYWNKGYASEALRIVLKYLIDEVGFMLIEANHLSENYASGKAMEKAGMRKEVVLRSRRINKDTNQVNDLVVYSIMAGEILR